MLPGLPAAAIAKGVIGRPWRDFIPDWKFCVLRHGSDPNVSQPCLAERGRVISDHSPMPMHEAR
jgi:hypothetical protein